MQPPSTTTPHSDLDHARALAATARSAALGTIARDLSGTPFVTLVAVSLAGAVPLLFLSELAEHTQNLRVDPRCSLLLTETGAGDPLARGRATLVGRAALHPDRQAAAARWVADHPASASYLGLGDFAFWQVTVESVRWVGGFGRMSWIPGDAWRTV